MYALRFALNIYQFRVAESFSEIRKQALIEKYNSLKESGSFHRFLTNGGRRMQQRITDTSEQ
ncbi:hypothetical protein F2Q69_00060759 [Brassica cretica]|uniref:Uncharacterized protein n=1 Tax=Brassica cretica TaxID=69181 RepID=A0A8S9RI09_BRACR|nr:hypothetical protein F2Q69_00060759 [Brassica cretica]